MPAGLKSSIGERRTADQAYRQRLFDDGKCIKCTQPRAADRADKKLCRRCTAKTAEASWRRRQGIARGRKGPPPVRGVRGWNFSTDDLITDHVKMATVLAWRVLARVPSSSSVQIEDMVGDALYGLVVAGRTYDQSYQVPFGAWATRTIRGAIYDGIRRWTYGEQQHPPRFVGLQERHGA